MLINVSLYDGFAQIMTNSFYQERIISSVDRQTTQYLGECIILGDKLVQDSL